MAGPTRASFGVGITITILGILALGFFVAFVILFGKANNAIKQKEDAERQNADIILAPEKNSEAVRSLMAEAKASNKSLVGYLTETYGGTMDRVTGSKRETPKTFGEKLKAADVPDNTNLMGVVAGLRSDLSAAQAQLAEANRARDAALADQKAAAERTEKLRKQQDESYKALADDVGRTKTDADAYRTGFEKAKADYEKRIETVQNESNDRVTKLKDEVGKAKEENLVLSNQLAALRGQKQKEILRPDDEASIVDGQVVGMNAAERQVFINLGRKNKITLGMEFGVYADARSARPDSSGNYPAAKASLEVISVDTDNAICRIVRENRGQPVLNGDVLVNPVYDPNKTYKFVIFGNFDADHDGLATAVERKQVAALVEEWGGKVSDDLGGDVDFLVLGARPQLGPKPGTDAPIEFVQAYVQREREIQKYDQMLRQATATGIPLLNENRLNTLLGRIR